MQVTQEQLVASAVEAFERATGQKNLSASPEAGYYTVKQWATMLNRSEPSHTKRTLDKLVDQGLASKEIYMIDGHRTTHYKMKETQ